jgi:hypothetical protein
LRRRYIPPKRLFLTRATRCDIQEDGILHSYKGFGIWKTANQKHFYQMETESASNTAKKTSSEQYSEDGIQDQVRQLEKFYGCIKNIKNVTTWKFHPV